jgi:predicted amidohydrolase YtcJ
VVISEVIDAEGGTILPGLIDSHIHLVPGALAQGLTFGVTTALDMFSQANDPVFLAGNSRRLLLVLRS